MNDGDKLVAWVREAADELENAHRVLDELTVPRRVDPDAECTLAARAAVLAQERDHFRRALIRIGNNESGHWGIIARKALSVPYPKEPK